MTMSRILASPNFQVEAWIEPPFSRSVLEAGVFVDGDDEFFYSLANDFCLYFLTLFSESVA